MYALFFSLVLRRFDAERVHHVSFRALRILMRLPGIRPLAHWMNRPHPLLSQDVWDLTFPAPLGLAAGFDKNAHDPDSLSALGFGFIEVGTLTAHAQDGNPQPRLFRLPADRAILNRMGFNNDGAAAAAARVRSDLRTADLRVPLGFNIGKSKVTPADEADTDYRISSRAIASLADYVVVNVSSPNTPGLRDLQSVTALRPILVAVRAELDAHNDRRVPLLVKIAPDLADDDIRDIAALVQELALDGVIATNTTIARTGLATPEDQVAQLGAGGLSGPMLRERSMEVLRLLRQELPQTVIISVGGISDAEDAWQRLRAGATLLQGYTGLIYGGPFWPRRIHRALAARMRAEGYQSLAQVRGA